TRPEGLLIPAAGLALLGAQCFPPWRRPWGGAAACGAALIAGVLVVGGPYMILIGGLTVKTTGNALIKDASAEADPPPPAEAGADGIASGPVLAVWWKGDPGDAAPASGRWTWGLLTLGEVLA